MQSPTTLTLVVRYDQLPDRLHTDYCSSIRTTLLKQYPTAQISVSYDIYAQHRLSLWVDGIPYSPSDPSSTVLLDIVLEAITDTLNTYRALRYIP